MTPFEHCLADTPLRPPPAAWRTRILANARAAERRGLTARLWPHPLAWGGLAAAWIVIVALNVSGPRGPELYAVTPAELRHQLPTPAEYLAAKARERELLLVVAAAIDAAPPVTLPRPQDL